MARHFFPHKPTVRNLLDSEAMAEAQVVFGQDLLDTPVVQVVTSLVPQPRAGSLVVVRPGSAGAGEAGVLRGLAGLVVIKPFVVSAEAAGAAAGQRGGGSGVPAPLSLDLELKHLAGLCAEAEIPLVLVPGFGEPAQAAEDIRLAFLGEVKSASARMHTALLSLVLEEGLAGLVEELSSWINRPVSVETAEFKVLASKNMGATPASQQRVVTEEIGEALNRQMRASPDRVLAHLKLKPSRIGRRLIMPIAYNGVVAGYLAAMVRPTDDVDALGEYLHAASLAAMVDFSRMKTDVLAFNATQKSLLKDLLSGRVLSAADQERLDQSFGFDLCDGLLVLAVQPAQAQQVKGFRWPEESCATTEVEGTRVFVIPYNKRSGRTWQQEVDAMVALLRKGAPDTTIQVGSSRLANTTLDLPDAYREARQALIVGSMIHGDQEFVIGYGDLGVKRLLYIMIDHPELDRFYEENLAPLEAYDAEWETELVSTLHVYLKQGANLNSAARALFIHRHTLRYRLEQIAEILNVDIDSQEVLLNLQIAFLIKEMKGKAQP